VVSSEDVAHHQVAGGVALLQVGVVVLGLDDEWEDQREDLEVEIAFVDPYSFDAS
jgi:hypothetical protein